MFTLKLTVSEHSAFQQFAVRRTTGNSQHRKGKELKAMEADFESHTITTISKGEIQ